VLLPDRRFHPSRDLPIELDPVLGRFRVARPAGDRRLQALAGDGDLWPLLVERADALQRVSAGSVIARHCHEWRRRKARREMTKVERQKKALAGQTAATSANPRSQVSYPNPDI
jgi:hypothetical protein